MNDIDRRCKIPGWVVLLRITFAAVAIAAVMDGRGQPQDPTSAPTVAQMARLHIYRDFARTLRDSPIYCDDVAMSRLNRSNYVVLLIPAGEHMLRGRHEVNQVYLDLIGGRDYYFRWMATVPERLVRLREEEWREALTKEKFTSLGEVVFEQGQTRRTVGAK